MPLAARPVAWPENIDLNDTTPYAFSAVFASTTDSHGRRALHTHPTGMIGMRIEGGCYGLELADGFVAVASRCAVWVPPGCPHNVVQAMDTKSLSLHIAPEVARKMPGEPLRCFLNPMTAEMLKHFAAVYGTTDKGIHAKRLASIIIEEVLAAPRLPRGFAPVSHDGRLIALFQRLGYPAFRCLTAEGQAAAMGVSAKTLGRLTLAETGLTYGEWRQHCVMLYALDDLAAGFSVEATAGSAGVKTTSAFIRAFAKRFGMTPGEYVKTHQLIVPTVTVPDSEG